VFTVHYQACLSWLAMVYVHVSKITIGHSVKATCIECTVQETYGDMQVHFLEFQVRFCCAVSTMCFQ